MTDCRVPTKVGIYQRAQAGRRRPWSARAVQQWPQRKPDTVALVFTSTRWLSALLAIPIGTPL